MNGVMMVVSHSTRDGIHLYPVDLVDIGYIWSLRELEALIDQFPDGLHGFQAKVQTRIDAIRSTL